jgi:hypothetical protein
MYIHIYYVDVTSRSVFSGKEVSDSINTGDGSVCLGLLVNVVDFLNTLSDFLLAGFLSFLRVPFRVKRPPTPKFLLMPWASYLMTSDFTMLAAAVYSPNPIVLGNR